MQRNTNTSTLGRIRASLTLTAGIICAVLSATCFIVAFSMKV